MMRAAILRKTSAKGFSLLGLVCARPVSAGAYEITVPEPKEYVPPVPEPAPERAEGRAMGDRYYVIRLKEPDVRVTLSRTERPKYRCDGKMKGGRR